MNFFQYFDRTFIINLPERVDRRARLEKHLKSRGFDFCRDRISFFEAIKPSHSNGFPSKGARGCFLSHLELLKMAQREKLSNILIMEDDVLISKKIKRMQDNIIESLSTKSWFFAYFGYNLEDKIDQPSTFHLYNGSLQTTCFYALKGEVLPRLIEYLVLILNRKPGDPNGGPMHVDGAYNRFRNENKDIKTYLSVPRLAIQCFSKSDVTLKNQNNTFIENSAFEALRSLLFKFKAFSF